MYEATVNGLIVGDVVRAKPTAHYGITKGPWTGKIVNIVNEYRISVQGINGFSGTFDVDAEDFRKVDDDMKTEKKKVIDAVTNSEKEEILACMQSLLDEYDYVWKTEALVKIINTWAEKKGDIISHMKKHPNYVDGKFMIAFDTDYERPMDKNGASEFSNWLCDGMILKVVHEFLPEELEERRIKDCCTWLPDNIYWFLQHLSRINGQFLEEEEAKYINDICPEAHAHGGQKTCRVINKMCKYIGYDKHPDYNRRFAKYADSMTPLTIKRHTILSVNPLDYLTMSFGNSWASCHTIDKTNKRDMPNSYEGMYSSGTMSYMLDGTSMVLYTVDAEYNGNEYWTQDKINRQMFHWGEEKLIQGRLYPQDNDGCGSVYTPYRNLVQEIISTIYEFPNLWANKKGTEAASEYIYSDGTNYKDYEYYDNCNISRIKGSTNEQYITVGHNPICIYCGCEHSTQDNINCCNKARCAECGAICDDPIWVDGEPYCRECAYICGECGEAFVGEGTETAHGQVVCGGCLDYYYVYCEECEEYEIESHTRYLDNYGISVCDNCLEEYFTVCDECNEYIRDEDTVVTEDGTFCHECHERMTNEDEAV